MIGIFMNNCQTGNECMRFYRHLSLYVHVMNSAILVASLPRPYVQPEHLIQFR